VALPRDNTRVLIRPRRAGEITVRFRDGSTLTEYVYLGPV
jgi:hypothetical protein